MILTLPAIGIFSRVTYAVHNFTTSIKNMLLLLTVFHQTENLSVNNAPSEAADFEEKEAHFPGFD